MSVHDEIKSFVQKTLGCGCPEEVFRHIEWHTGIEAPAVMPFSMIKVGNRLLIYIAVLSDEKTVPEIVSMLAARGREERDRLGFNRFRLVIGAEHPESFKRAATDAFERSGIDQKMYLHVIPAAGIPSFRQDSNHV